MSDVTVYEKRSCTTCRKVSGCAAPGGRAVLARPPEKVLELFD